MTSPDASSSAVLRLPLGKLPGKIASGYKAKTDTNVGPVVPKFSPSTKDDGFDGLREATFYVHGLKKFTLVPPAATTTGPTKEIGVDNVQNTVHYF
ncbi:MAG: hypothetical protein HETSPECPRED_001090 [Heterodermia speciosa]|uniref:Uncharacterized protein n=1 Tax=Heterodermia speciosa TaxID=116794 RepID=A0A8H3J0M1_9LECA|nr:MAG: hypothetical protein HETSPECPRED_001090 [Heterodermia speciosa]